MDAPLSSHEAHPDSQAKVTSGWQARIELGFRCNARADPAERKTLLGHRRRYGPLTVQRPFYPEGDICHVYLLHPPGGIVGGDQLAIEVAVERGASALITAPGATKFYRSLAESATIVARFDVDGELEWLPQENIVFCGAEIQQRCLVNLHSHSRYIGWEIHCFGRPASAERFNQGNARFTTEICHDGRPLQIDRLLVSPASKRSDAAGLRGHWVTATLYATPVERSMLHALQERYHVAGGDHSMGLTLIDNLLVVRYLGNSTTDARQKLTEIWHQLRPEVIRRSAMVPRIWLT